jgi:hypothetical protein
VDLNGSTYWSPYLGGCGGQTCTTPAGTELCAAVAKNDGLSGTYTCISNLSDCQTALANNVANVVCGSKGYCCVPKPTASAANSAKPSTSIPEQLPDPLGGANIPTFIGSVIKTFAGIAGTIALIMFVYGGITLIMSGGESAKVANGKKILVNASIGLILIFSAYTFVSSIIGAILAE